MFWKGELILLLFFNKQSFAIDLCSHLCIHYPIPRFFNQAKLCLAFAELHLTMLPDVHRAKFYFTILPALERICSIFPSFTEQLVKILVQLAQKNAYTMSSVLPTALDVYSVSEELFKSNVASHVVPALLRKDDDLKAGVKRTGVRPHQSKALRFTRDLLNMDWKQFERTIKSSSHGSSRSSSSSSNLIDIEEALLLAIHKTFAMLCTNNALSDVFRDKSLEA